MRKIIVLSVLLTVALLACTRKVAPDSGATRMRQTETAKKEGEEVQQKKEDEPAYDPDSEKGKPPTSEPPVNPPTLPPPSTPKEPEKASDEETGRTIYNSKCKQCHAAKNVSRYTLAQWESILKTMVPNAKLSAEEEYFLLAYIRANAK